MTLGEETGLPPEARTFIVPPRLTDTTTDTNMTDTPIRCASCVLDALRDHPKHLTFTASSDKEGGRQIQCTSKRKDGSPGRSVITLHIDCGNRLRELIMERSQEGGQKTRHFARFQQNLPPATALRTRAPVWLIASPTDGATGSGSSSRKRRIAPPPAPDAARPRSDSGVAGATLSSIPQSSAAQQQTWTRQHEEEFGPLLEAWNQATGMSAGGDALLRHLSAQCDKEEAAGHGTRVDAEKSTIFEFTVKVHPTMPAVRVWRGVDGDGNIDLRLAPQEDEPDLSLSLAPPEVGFDARQALLDEMGDLAKRRAGQQSGKP